MIQLQDSFELKTKLHYSHGIEIENHLILKNTGTILVGTDLLRIWDEMFSNAFEYLTKIKEKKSGPINIIHKIAKIEVLEVEKHERKLKFIWVHYKLGKEIIKVNVFGPDPNISQITWLLELVTPPCEYLEELDWWIKILYECAINGLNKFEPKVVLLPIGLNPMEERYRSGLSCGSHHHIGISDKKEKIAIYNMFRNFVPHLMGLSASSPFINQLPNGNPKIRELNGRKQIIGRYTHSNRLANNTGQIGPNIPGYLPILKDNDTKEIFSNYVKKNPPDDRMVDIYPFTDYNTIELRFFDAQPFSENRLAIVMLLQALALKAKTLIKNKEKIPTISSAILFENRQKSIEMGLLAQFSIDPDIDPEFGKFYNYNKKTGNKATRLIDSVISLILYVKDELLQFNKPDILNFLLVPILGTNEYEPPFAITEYLISEYLKDNNILNLFSKIYYKNDSRYPLTSKLTLDSLIKIEIEPEKSLEKPISNLSTKLQQDMQSRRKESKRISTTSPKGKNKTKKIEKRLEKGSELKRDEDSLAKDQIRKGIPESSPVEDEDNEEIVTQEIPVFMKGQIPLDNKLLTKEKEKVQISAFDKIEEEDLYIPAIEIEAKYTKIESKIANVMRKRREDIEIKKKELYIQHLENDRRDFLPKPKNVKFDFPNQISGKNVLGYVNIDWQKNSIFKLRNNPIYFYLTAEIEESDKKIQLKTVSMAVNIQRSIETSSSKIPLFFSLDDLQGEMNIEITAVTGTNELIFTENIKLKRKDEINLSFEEFYINGDYGPVECTIQIVNKLSKIKGNFELYLAIPDYEPISINSSSISLEQNEVFQNFNFVDLDAIYHSSPFYLVAEVIIGKLKKSKMYEAIRIKPTTDAVVHWDILTEEGIPNFKERGKKSKFDLKFVFNFMKKLPPINISIFMNTLPEGSTKNIVNAEVKRNIDENDGYMISKTIKLPKNCNYLFFDIEIKTKKGAYVPIDLISDPLGFTVNDII
jgi:hypothetical protein